MPPTQLHGSQFLGYKKFQDPEAWFQDSVVSQQCLNMTRQGKTMSVDGLRCILYALIYIPYMRTILSYTILYHYIQTGRPTVPISSELKLKTNSWLAQYLSKYRHKQHLLTSIHTGEYVHRCHLVQINSKKIVWTYRVGRKTGPQTHDHNSVNS